MEARKVDWKVLQREAESRRGDGASVMYLAVDGRLLGLIVVSVPVKATMQEALEALREAGIEVVMATGDGVTAASRHQRRTRARKGQRRHCHWNRH